MKPWLKRRKNLEFYENLLKKLRLEYEYNYNILLRIASENFEKLFQMIKDDITKENTKTIIRTCSHNFLFINGEVIQELCLRVLVFVLNYEQFNIYLFLRFRLLHFFFSNKRKTNHLIWASFIKLDICSK